MPAILPPNLPEDPCHELLTKAGIVRIHRGKVRSTYQLADGKLLQLASNGISVFDFVLNALVESKGEVLTAMTINWLASHFTGSAHHLIAFGAGIDPYLPPSIRKNAELQRRAIVVEKLTMYPVECVVRGYLTGSGWTEYQQSQSVCGVPLKAGLFDGAKLEEPIFTPTTKEETGHDKPMTFEQMCSVVGTDVGKNLRSRSLLLYDQGAEKARQKGVIIADTKFEFGYVAPNLHFMIVGDEFLTPDSSRFWLIEEWVKASAERKSPPSHDKQLVREYAKTIVTPWGKGLHNKNLDPKNPEHCAFVHSQEIPADVLIGTTKAYQDIFARLTGSSLLEFQKQVMHVAA